MSSFSRDAPGSSVFEPLRRANGASVSRSNRSSTVVGNGSRKNGKTTTSNTKSGSRPRSNSANTIVRENALVLPNVSEKSPAAVVDQPRFGDVYSSLDAELRLFKMKGKYHSITELVSLYMHLYPFMLRFGFPIIPVGDIADFYFHPEQTNPVLEFEEILLNMCLLINEILLTLDKKGIDTTELLATPTSDESEMSRLCIDVLCRTKEVDMNHLLYLSPTIKTLLGTMTIQKGGGAETWSLDNLKTLCVAMGLPVQEAASAAAAASPPADTRETLLAKIAASPYGASLISNINTGGPWEIEPSSAEKVRIFAAATSGASSAATTTAGLIAATKNAFEHTSAELQSEALGGISLEKRRQLLAALDTAKTHLEGFIQVVKRGILARVEAKTDELLVDPGRLWGSSRWKASVTNSKGTPLENTNDLIDTILTAVTQVGIGKTAVSLEGIVSRVLLDRKAKVSEVNWSALRNVVTVASTYAAGVLVYLGARKAGVIGAEFGAGVANSLRNAAHVHNAGAGGRTMTALAAGGVAGLAAGVATSFVASPLVGVPVGLSVAFGTMGTIKAADLAKAGLEYGGSAAASLAHTLGAAEAIEKGSEVIGIVGGGIGSLVAVVPAFYLVQYSANSLGAKTQLNLLRGGILDEATNIRRQLATILIGDFQATLSAQIEIMRTFIMGYDIPEALVSKLKNYQKDQIGIYATRSTGGSAARGFMASLNTKDPVAAIQKNISEMIDKWKINLERNASLVVGANMPAAELERFVSAFESHADFLKSTALTQINEWKAEHKKIEASEAAVNAWLAKQRDEGGRLMGVGVGNLATAASSAAAAAASGATALFNGTGSAIKFTAACAFPGLAAATGPFAAGKVVADQIITANLASLGNQKHTMAAQYAALESQITRLQSEAGKPGAQIAKLAAQLGQLVGERETMEQEILKITAAIYTERAKAPAVATAYDNAVAAAATAAAAAARASGGAGGPAAAVPTPLGAAPFGAAPFSPPPPAAPLGAPLGAAPFSPPPPAAPTPAAPFSPPPPTPPPFGVAPTPLGAPAAPGLHVTPLGAAPTPAPAPAAAVPTPLPAPTPAPLSAAEMAAARMAKFGTAATAPPKGGYRRNRKTHIRRKQSQHNHKKSKRSSRKQNHRTRKAPRR